MSPKKCRRAFRGLVGCSSISCDFICLHSFVSSSLEHRIAFAWEDILSRTGGRALSSHAGYLFRCPGPRLVS